MGFFRPLVSLSFALNYFVFELAPKPYGLVNLALVLAIAFALVDLIRRLGLSAGPAVFGAAVWAFNFHGINMAVLWISGRTSLLATLFAVLAARAFVSHKFLATGVFVLASLLSKEEPLLLPAVFGVWIALDYLSSAATPTRQLVRLTAAVAASVLAVGIYLALRYNTDAITPSTSPSYYQFAPKAAMANVVQYADRSLTFATVVLLMGAALVSWPAFRISGPEKSIIQKGAVWLVFGFALTIMLPIRSSLYVCYPSVGTALIAAAIGSAQWRAISRRRLAVTALLLLPVMLLPIYRLRNARLANEAELASNVVRILQRLTTDSQVHTIILRDDLQHRPTLADAFGDTLPTMVQLYFPNRQLSISTSTESVADPDDDEGTLTLFVRGKTLVERD
jgi:hypothetical protein